MAVELEHKNYALRKDNEGLEVNRIEALEVESDGEGVSRKRKRNEE
jgi:hypothetical protein